MQYVNPVLFRNAYSPDVHNDAQTFKNNVQVQEVSLLNKYQF